MFYVYVLRNVEKKKQYIGQTNDLEKRLKRHNQLLPTKSTSYITRNSGVWKTIYVEEYKTRIEALRRGKQLKSARGREFIKSLGR